VTGKCGLGIGLHDVSSFVLIVQAGEASPFGRGFRNGCVSSQLLQHGRGSKSLLDDIRWFRLCLYPSLSAASARQVIPVLVPGTVSVTRSYVRSSLPLFTAFKKLYF
jgi:hypothetical protein